MNLARLKELFASFLRTRHIARRYRRLILLAHAVRRHESVLDPPSCISRLRSR